MAGLLKSDAEIMQSSFEEPVEADVQVEAEEAELDTNFEIEIVDPSVYGQTGKSTELVEAEAKMAALEAEKRRLEESQGQNAALAATMESVKALQEQLAGGIKVDAGKTEEAAPQLDIEALKKEFSEGLWTDPFTKIAGLIGQAVNPLRQEIQSANQTAAKSDARAKLLMDDTSRSFYAKYQNEVEESAASFTGPDAYSKAMNLVKATHLDDIVAEKVAQAIAEQAVAAPAKPTPVPYTGVGQPSAPAVPVKKQMTPGMNAWVHRMQMKGIADKDWLIGRAQEKKAAGEIVG